MMYLKRWHLRLILLFKMFLVLIVGLIFATPAAGVTAFLTFTELKLPGNELPDEPKPIEAYPSVVVDSKNNVIAEFRQFDHTVKIQPKDISKKTQDAFIAIEDRRFWEHSGVDLEGILRAAQVNYQAGEVIQGGSTITQQYVKNAYLNSERSIDRKVTEAQLAIELEKRKTKEEILFAYLNTSYFGSGAYGIGAAAEIYFRKNVSELTLSESAILAGIVKAPTAYNPVDNPKDSEKRRKAVLEAMFEQGLISDSEYKKALEKQIWLVAPDEPKDKPMTKVYKRDSKGSVEYPFLSDLIENELLEEFGPDKVYRGGLVIETTIDFDLQAKAEEVVNERLENTESPIDMSLVTIEPDTGYVRAMVGGRDYGSSQVNLAVGGSTGFQPGSSFKPIVLASAFNQGLNPETVYAAPSSWSPPGCSGSNCSISNYSKSGYGSMSLRKATHLSVNTVFAKLVIDTGVKNTAQLASDLGLSRIEPESYYGASLALGAAETSPMEMASAYGTFANRGVRVEPTVILKVTDNKGNVLIDNTVRSSKRVLSEIVADNVTDVLTGVIESGTGKAADIKRPAAGKTGTAQSYSAAWFVGYTPQLSTAIWMGHRDSLKPLRNVNGVGSVTGGSHPAVAWSEFMSYAHKDLEVKKFPEPKEITKKIADKAKPKSKLREFTVVGSKMYPDSVDESCDGSSCVLTRARTRPALPSSPVPTSKSSQVIKKVDPSTDENTTTTEPVGGQ